MSDHHRRRGWLPMLFGTRVQPMFGLLATLAGWPLLPRQQPGQPQARHAGPTPGVMVIDDRMDSR